MNKTVIAVVIVIALAVVAYFLLRPMGPADAPENPQAQAGWTRGNVEGLSYAYPATLGKAYLSEAEWPPKVAKLENYSCSASGVPQSSVTEHTAGGRTYCDARESEGAAGSTYVTYTYTSDRGDAVLSTTFTVRYPQCGNYDEPEQGACRAEQAAFDPTALAVSIIGSIGLP